MKYRAGICCEVQFQRFHVLCFFTPCFFFFELWTQMGQRCTIKYQDTGFQESAYWVFCIQPPSSKPMLCRTPARAIVTNLGDSLCDIIKGWFMGHTFSEEVKEVPLWQICQTMHPNGTLKKDIPKCKVSIHTIRVYIWLAWVFFCYVCLWATTSTFNASILRLWPTSGWPEGTLWTTHSGCMDHDGYPVWQLLLISSLQNCTQCGDRQLSWPSVPTQTPNQLWCQKYRLSRQHWQQPPRFLTQCWLHEH